MTRNASFALAAIALFAATLAGTAATNSLAQDAADGSALLAAGAASSADAAAPAVQQGALAKMPVKEITVFKDGHAFVLHEGTLPTDDAGNVHLDYLPTPVIGTFWPYSADGNVKLTGVSAGKQRVRIERTALEVRELLEANVGAKVLIKEGERTYAATIVAVPTRSAEEVEAASPAHSGPQLPQKGQIILLRTTEGTKAVPIDTIREVTFVDEPKTRVVQEEIRNLLTLQLQWPDAKPQPSAKVGMTYLQRGIRWIPHYKVTIDGKGNAVLQLQATILNEMADIENVDVHLVIGVPTFDFKGTADPIALQETVAQLSQYFQENAQTAYALSNSMMTQVARMGETRGAAPAAQGPDLGPDVAVGGQSEDLFIFSLKDVSLKKGQRMVVPVSEQKLPYRDVYSLEIPIAPPPEVLTQFNDQQQAELARLMTAPRVMHKIRLQNSAPAPLTTAPAILVKDGRVLGQGMMTYTAPGAEVDLKVTAAVNVSVHRSDKETQRSPNAAQWAGTTYDRIDLAGSIRLTSFAAEPVEVEVTRYVLGAVSNADDGVVEKLDATEQGWAAAHPAWWRWYGWPGWWHRLNTTSRVTWNVTLEKGKPQEMAYKWHYFWRW